MAFYQQRQQQKSKRKLWACNICNVVRWRVFSWVGILPLFQCCTQWVEILYKVILQVSPDRLIIWRYGLWSFQTWVTKLERFLPKNEHTQRKLLKFENWVSEEVSKSAKSPNLLTFKVNFQHQKLSESFSTFFSLKNINLGAHFLLLTFVDNINF